jgi:hypothetical protein
MAEITQKQLEANRRNAQKSTGPKTQEGKALVALNPIKHGLLSKEVLLADEDESALVELGKRMRHHLAPVGEMETVLVDKIIAAVWRMRRILRIEQEMIDHEMASKKENRLSYERKKTPVTIWEALEHDLTEHDILARLTRYEAHLERGFYRALHELQRLQAARGGEHVPAPAVVDVDISGQEMGLLGEKA